jgi:DNA-binding NtrC family response regulator
MGTILVADDDAHLRQTVISILDRAGWSAVEVGDGRDAVDAVRGRQFDLVFLGVALPGLNGLEALRILHRSCPQVKVCMLTAFDQLDLLAKATRYAAVDFISKPVTASDVLRVVDKWCRPSSLNAALTG